jgi:hypothetical protein
MNSRFVIRCAGLSFIALLSVTSIGFAEVIQLKADLKATDEVPPNDSAGKGTLEATYDSSSKQLSYTADYSGLTGNATMAHFHGPADPGKNAPIVVPVQGSVASPIKGTATLTDAQADELLAGKLYFNVHTEKNKGGEIRGQVTK